MLGHRGRHLLVEEVGVRRVIRVVRTDVPFASLLELRQVFSELNRVLDRVDRSAYGLLVDTRNAPPRNDPGFEEAFRPLRKQVFQGFRRRAVLVRSLVGRLQVERHAREDGVTLATFVDEDEAIGWLAARG